jgi:ribosomal-protein-alanine N-acetyltransferase
MIVLQHGPPEAHTHDNRSWLAKLLLGDDSPEPAPLVGYAGFWQIEDEAHISTITVHPKWRGNKLGELLLWKMIDLAIHDGADKVTLEVRVSNAVAKALYKKYRFRKVGKRRNYYRDNNEDAHVMMLEPLDDEFMAQFDAFGKALYNRAHIIDHLPRP